MGKIIKWTKAMDSFIINNFHLLDRKELYKKFNLSRAVVDARILHLGLRKTNKHIWTEEQIQYLKDNYRIKGNNELISDFEKLDKENNCNGCWSIHKLQNMISKLNLKRTREELKAIYKRNFEYKNSISDKKILSDDFITHIFLKHKPKISREEILKNKPLLELKRKQIILNRELKKHKNDTTNIHRT